MADEKHVQAQAPGKSFRKGMTLVELTRKFPDDTAAEAWILNRVSPDHLDQYVAEFAGRHRRRRMGAADTMAESARGVVGQRLPYAELVGAPPS